MLATIDEALTRWRHLNFVESGDVTDLLLDLRRLAQTGPVPERTN